MNEALCSILCGEYPWHVYSFDSRFIKFNKDGTGELWCAVDLNFFIALVFEWKSLLPLSEPDPVLEAASAIRTRTGTWTRQPQLLGQLNLEITFTKRPAEDIMSWLAHSTREKAIHEYYLTDAAFRTKTFKVRIEKGNFKEPLWVGYKESLQLRYSLRLLFDKSPYPPREEWERPEHGADGNNFWDNVEFVGRSIENTDYKGPAMNEVVLSGRDSCVVS